LCSDHPDEQAPFLPGDTAAWLAEKKIKMLAAEAPGILWETDPKAPQPNNSPTHRNMLGNNIPITYPLTNITTLKSDRVFYIGLPLSVERFDATWIRAIALEEL
jgi:kynurenine formamidase